MIVRYPQVNDEGRPIEGAEVIFRFDKVIMVEHMVKYNYERMDDNNREHRVEVIPNCCQITLDGDSEFYILADFNEIAAQFMGQPTFNVETL